MSTKYTMAEIAGDFDLWGEYVDPSATMTEEQFDALTVAEKIAMQREMFPGEAAEEDAAESARIDDIVHQMEFVSAGLGEVNERREEAALREWLADYDGDYTAELQAEWNEWVEENEPQFDEEYD